jgi:hypothetical protein
MSDPIDPHKLFEALAGPTGGKVISKHEYHRLTGPRMQIPADELPTKWELEVKGDAVIVHIEGSKAAMERVQRAAEEVGLEEAE